MKNLINEESGEVYTITKEEIEKLKNENELVSKANSIVAKELTDEIYSMYEQYEAIKSQKEMFEFKLKKLFEENGIKKFENEYMSITYTPRHTMKRIDTELLRKANLYDEFAKESEVKESIKVRFR